MLGFIYLFSILYFSVKSCEGIINGTDAKQGEFPFVVSLRNESGRHYCGGALLKTRKHILTAAHCLYTDRSMIYSNVVEMYKPEDVTVLVGTVHADFDTEEKLFEVEKLIPHPNYDILNSTSLVYDIGIIVLKQKVNLASASGIEIFDKVLTAGMNATQMGWGVSKREYIDRWITQANLQKLQSKIIEPSQCVKILKTEKNYRVDSYETDVPESKLICLYKKVNAGICYRDSGSPLIVNGRVAAVAISCIPCARNYPDLYTPVNIYLDFIRLRIND